jgi:hypothetical protein
VRTASSQHAAVVLLHTVKWQEFGLSFTDFTASSSAEDTTGAVVKLICSTHDKGRHTWLGHRRAAQQHHPMCLQDIIMLRVLLVLVYL